MPKLFWKFLFSVSILFLIKVIFWRTHEFLIPVGRCVVKSYCPDWPYFWGGFLGEGANASICVEILDLAPKKLQPFGVRSGWQNFGINFFPRTWVLEELWIFDPRWQIRRQKLLPKVPLVLGRLPWRRGKWVNMCRNPGLGTKNAATIWCCDWMMIW